jgi:tight adherence protein B
MTPARAKALAILLVLVLTLIVALLLWLRLRADRRAFRDRLSTVTTPHARVNPIEVMGRSAWTRPDWAHRIGRRAAGVFGFDPARADQIPVPAWVILGMTLLLARGVAALVEVVVGPLGLLGLPGLWLLLSRFVFGWFATRRVQALYAQFPDALAMIVRAVRVGIPLSEGVRAVSREAPQPTAGEFSKLHDQISIGVSLEDALRDLADRNSLPEYRFFATTLALQSQTGGGLSETLENLGEVMRKRLALNTRAHALASEAKTSIFILAALPFVAGGAMAVLNPEYMGRLFNDPMGQQVLGGAILSLGSGLITMRTMIKKSLS